MSDTPEPLAAQLRLAEQLQQLTEGLAAAHTQAEVLSAALTPALAALSALAGAVLLLDQPATNQPAADQPADQPCLRVVALQGRRAQTLWQDGPLTPETPAGDVTASRQPLYFEHAGTLKAAYPHLEEHTGGVAAVATAVLPLLLDGQALGVLILDFPEPHTFTPEERRFLSTLAAQAALALNRAHLLAQREREHAAVQASEARFRALVALSPLGVAIGRLDGHLSLVNDAYLSVLGFTRAQFEAGELDWQQLSPPEYRALDRESFEQALETGQTSVLEKTMYTASGELIPIQVTRTRYDGQSVIGYVQDLRPVQARQQVLRDERTRLAEQVVQGAAALQSEQAALRAFVQFAEDAGQTRDLAELARLALDTLQALIPGATAVLTERAPSGWALRHWTHNLDPLLLSSVRERGFPLTTPVLAKVVATGEPDFVDGWDEAAQDVPYTRQFGAVAHYPVVQGGQTVAIIGVAVGEQGWSGAQQAVIRAVGRSFALLYDRLAAAAALRLQREEALRRARVLEVAERWNDDLNLVPDPHDLIARAQTLLRELVPNDAVVYYEREGDTWRVRLIQGHFGSEGLAAAHREGLPHATTDNLRLPSETREPYYQDVYDQQTDGLGQHMGHVASTAMVPLLTGLGVRGVFGVARFGGGGWTGAERELIETVTRSLRLALDRAERVLALDQERAASAAFVQFTEEVSRVQDLDTLVQQAFGVITRLYPQAAVNFYTVEPPLFRARFMSRETPEVDDLMRAGLPLTMPIMARMLETGEPNFVEGWDGEAEGLLHLEGFQTGVLFPVVTGEQVTGGQVTGGQVTGALGVVMQQQDRWEVQQRVVLTAVWRSFALVYMRLAEQEELQQSRELAEQHREVAEQRAQALEAFATLTADLTVQLDDLALIRRAQEVVLSLLPPGHSVYWEPVNDLWRVMVQTGDVGHPDLQAAIDAGLPTGQMPTLDTPWSTREAYYQDQYAVGSDLDAELTRQARSVVALPVFQGRERRGVLNFTTTRPHRWDAADRAMLTSVAQGLKLALERAVQTRRLEEERAAAAAFVQFTEAASQMEDVEALARLVLDVLQDLIPGINAAFYEVQGGLLRALAINERTVPELTALAWAGFLPLEVPIFAEAFRTHAPVFVPDRQEPQGQVTMYQTGAVFPVLRQGEVVAALGLGLELRPTWSEREQAFIRAVGRSFSLLYDRLSAAQDLQAQKAEAEARTRSLEAFAELTTELDVHHEPLVLIRRALEIALSLLPPGYAAYWEPVDGLWRALVLVGDVGSSDLQTLIDAGLPVGATPTLDRPYRSGQPQFDDAYDTAADVDPEEFQVGHLKSIACLPVLVGGEVTGIFNVPLFSAREWSAADRAILISAVRSLSLALEGAQGVTALAARSRELERSNETLNLANAELEAFAYSASHDMRTPVRHVQGFTDLLLRSVPDPSEKTQRYGRVVLDAATRMNTLIDAMLVLSRAGRSELHLGPVDLNSLVQQGEQDADLEFPGVRVTWRVSVLPVVQGDAATLQQVLSNLISNAVKYSSKRAAPTVEVWAEELPDTWRVSVRDNGVGFDPNYRHKLFGVFQRLQGQEYPGTGVGLATIKRIVQRHGGEVFAEGSLDAGATFSFTLPKTQTAAAP